MTLRCQIAGGKAIRIYPGELFGPLLGGSHCAVQIWVATLSLQVRRLGVPANSLDCELCDVYVTAYIVHKFQADVFRIWTESWLNLG